MPRKLKKDQNNESQNNESQDNETFKEILQNNDESQKDKDSSEISDIDENESLSDCFNYDIKKEENIDNIDEEAQTEYVKTVVFDYVIKYIKIDDIIKKKQNEHKKEMKAIKDTKDQLETFLLNYLEKVNEEYVELANKSKLTKTETTTKSAPKLEDIALCLIDGFKEHEIYENDDEIKRVVTDLMKKIDDKRETKTRTFLRRLDVGKKPKKNDDKGDDKISKISKKKQNNTKSNDKEIAQEIAQDNVQDNVQDNIHKIAQKSNDVPKENKKQNKTKK